jgi:dTDP-L-rhamnose 4-epimerase
MERQTASGGPPRACQWQVIGRHTACIFVFTVPTRALITGGAGFIGSYVADELLASGYQVRALDLLTPQVHGTGESRPAYLDPEVELVVGDVRDPESVRNALCGVDVVVHLAAAVGVGQSMYRIADYTSVNTGGTAVLLEALIARPAQRLVVASSMSIYGEGRYRDAAGRQIDSATRTAQQLRRREWEPTDERGQRLAPVPTPETKRPQLASIYALSKLDQELMALMIGRAYGIPTAALRFFNVYGPRQALSNPYTGVLAIFACRYLNRKPPLVFEDGLQQRDFVHVRDVARACRLALTDGAPLGVFNIGSGQARTILDVAAAMKHALGSNVEPRVTGQHRVGDVRHCVADISLARRGLGFEPRVSFEQGILELANWLEGKVSADGVEAMHAELASRGLAV